MRFFVRRPRNWDSLSQLNSKRFLGRTMESIARRRSSKRFLGRTMESIARRRSSPSIGRASHRMRASVWHTSARMRASFGVAASTSSAPTM